MTAEEVAAAVKSIKGGKPYHEMSPYFLEAILDVLVIIANKDVCGTDPKEQARTNSR